MAVALRIAGFIEGLAALLCRRRVLFPLLAVLVVSFFVHTPVFGWVLTAVCMLVFLWAINKSLQRLLTGSVA